jgi:hypothetical protein
MKAFIHEANENGQGKCGTGRVTPEYQNIENMKRYCLNYLPKGNYVVEVFYNWDNRYGQADLTFEVRNAQG